MTFRILSQRSSRRLLSVAFAGVLAGGIVGTGAFAQDRGRGGFGGGPPGGFGGFGGRAPSVSGTLMNDNARKEVGITDEQQAQIDKMNDERREQFRSGGVDFRSMSDEERRSYFEKQQAETETKLKAILKPEQYTRLQQLGFHRAGPAALRDDNLAKEFGLSQAQKDQLEKIRDDQRSSERETWRLPDDEKAKIKADFDAKFLAVLTPAQQQQWKEKTGPAPKEFDSGSRASTGPSGGPSTGSQPAQRYRTDSAKPIEGMGIVHSWDADFKAPANVPKASDDVFMFSFNGAPWDDVLDMFAKKAGLTLDIHDMPPGTFTYFDTNKYTATQALDVINRYLADRGYILIKRDNALVCYNLENPIPSSLIPNVTLQDLPNRGENELLRLVLPIQVGDVEQVAKEIDASSLKGPQGTVSSMKSTNTIIVTDLGTNLRRIAEMVRDIVPPAENGLVFHSYHLNFIPAEDAESVIRTQLGVAQTVTNVSSGASGSDRGRFGGGWPGFGGGFGDRGRDGGSSSSQMARTTATPTPGATVQADTRLNNLFVTATPAQQKVVEEVLRNMDVDDGTGRKITPSGSNKPYLEVYTLKSADAREVAKSLNSILPGVVVNEDGGNNTVHIMATMKQHEQVRAHIALMDGRGGLQEVAVIPLSKLDPTQAMSSLRAVFSKDGANAPTIEPDTYGRQLIVRATAEQQLQIREVLKGLGEDGTGRRTAQTGTLRAFNLQGRDADQIMQMTQRMLGPGASSRIRIVTPQDRGAVNGIRTPSQNRQPEPTSLDRDEPVAPPVRRTSTPGGRASYEGRPGANVARMMAAMAAEESKSLTAAVAEDDAAGENAEEKKPETPSASSKEAPITVTVIGDQLVLQSKDEAALDQLEGVLQQSLEYLPPSNKPTIFILQSADPVETANTLVAMFPDLTLNASATSNSSGTMSNLFSGVSSFGSSLWDASGMSSMSNNRFQVIPNTRLNALFVYGPPHKVAEVEQMIEILDATDWPENARSRRPRMIELKYADVNEVYTIVKDVYADYLESESQRQAQNPLAALAGGGRGGSREVTPPRMTLGIDHNSSKLIVSANDEIYQQVLSLVETLDQAALESQRTVRVVQIKQADAATLQNALQQIVPKVQPAATSRSSGGSGQQGGNNNGGQNGGNGQDDARRQQMMQMFGGGSPFGGRTGGGFSPFGSGGRTGFTPGGGFNRGGFGGNNFGGNNFGRGGRGGR